MEKNGELIAARATPDSVSAISVVRLSGRGASSTVEEIMGLKPGRLQGMRRVVGDFAGKDRLVALSWPEGKSYTGEEMVDLMCHGTPGTAESVLKVLMQHGARPAKPGEFTRRAWLNGRVTSLDVMVLSARFRNLPAEDASAMNERLEEILVETEALIEFGEEHEAADEERVRILLLQAVEAASELSDSLAGMEILPKAFFMGPVNSGKSTLFNLLCGRKAAVVSDVPGTTRDGVEVTAQIAGRMVRIADTAGTGGDILDREALEITLAGMRKGDRIVWMDPEMKDPPEKLKTGHRILRVASMSDRGIIRPRGEWIPVSSISGEGIDMVRGFISQPDGGSPSWILDRVTARLEGALEAHRSNDLALTAEILSESLEELRGGLGSGEAVERALEVFCVGK